jgi:hypothetical protein
LDAFDYFAWGGAQSRHAPVHPGQIPIPLPRKNPVSGYIYNWGRPQNPCLRRIFISDDAEYRQRPDILNRPVTSRAQEVGAARQPMSPYRARREADEVLATVDRMIEIAHAADEKWYQQGPPVIEELAERLWAYENIPGKLPWAELGVQGRIGPRRKAYEMLDIVYRHIPPMGHV